MLIVFPVGLLASSVICDIIYVIIGNKAWETVAFWNIAIGVIGGLTAALFGLIDWLNIPANTRAKQIGMFHGLGNVVFVLLFTVSWLLRLNSADLLEARGGERRQTAPVETHWHPDPDLRSQPLG